MDANTEALPVSGGTSVWNEKRPALTIGYLGACAAATLGWSIGLTWVAISITEWLFF